MDQFTELSLLYDFYGKLLPKRQREVMDLYEDENLSLSEIAEEFDISRQAVHDALKNGRDALHRFEDELGLVAKFSERDKAVGEIDATINELITSTADETTVNKLRRIKSIIDEIDI